MSSETETDAGRQAWNIGQNMASPGQFWTVCLGLRI